MARAIAPGAFAAIAMLIGFVGLAGPASQARSDEIPACTGTRVVLDAASDAQVDIVPVLGGSSRRTGALVEQALERAIAHMDGALGPADVRPFAAPHPFLRTAAGSVALSRGQVVVVAIGSPRGPVLVRFVNTSGPASEAEQTAVRRAVAALRLEPGSELGAGCVTAAVSAGPGAN